MEGCGRGGGVSRTPLRTAIFGAQGTGRRQEQLIQSHAEAGRAQKKNHVGLDRFGGGGCTFDLSGNLKSTFRFIEDQGIQ